MSQIDLPASSNVRSLRVGGSFLVPPRTEGVANADHWRIMGNSRMEKRMANE